MYVLVCIVFACTLMLCSASWFIKSYRAMQLESHNVDNYHESLAEDTNGEYFTTGGPYSGSSQAPRMKLAGAKAFFGEYQGSMSDDAFLEMVNDPENGFYRADFVSGIYRDMGGDQSMRIANAPHQGVVAGTHYYKIIDLKTGQPICLKHKIEITASHYAVSSFKAPDKAVYFSGESLSQEGLSVTWKNADTNTEATYAQFSGNAKEGSITEANSKYTPIKGEITVGIKEIYSSVTDSAQLMLIMNNYTAEDYTLSYTVLPKCLFVSSSGQRVYYSSITYALQELQNQSGTLIALPSFTYTDAGGTETTYAVSSLVHPYTHEITENRSVGAGIKLLIPFDTANEDKRYGDNETERKIDAVLDPATYRKNQITVKQGKTLTVYGTVNISAVISGGNGGDHLNSMVAGSYSEILMESGTLDANGNLTKQPSKIVAKSGAKIYAYGVISKGGGTAADKPTVTLESGSRMTTVLTIIEHRGGSAFVEMIGGILSVSNPQPVSSPFNRFYTRSVTADVIVNNGANVYGYYNLYMADTNIDDELLLFGGAGAFFQMKSGSSLQYTYDTETNQNKVSAYGSMQVNPITVKVKQIIEVNISTKTVFLPISHYWHIDFYPDKTGSAMVTIPDQNVKVLPGGYVNIHSGVTADVKSLAIYDSASRIPDAGKFVYTSTYSGSDGGTVIVGGSLLVRGGLGGNVLTESSGAVLTLSSASATATELSATDGGSGVNVTLNATGPVHTAYGTVTPNTALSATTYYSAKPDSTAGWFTSTVNVSYYNTDGTLIKTEQVTARPDKGIGTMSFISNPQDMSQYCDEWYTAATGGAKVDPTKIYTDVSVYAQSWKTATLVDITYNMNLPDGWIAPANPTFSGGAAQAPEGIPFTGVHTESTWDTDKAANYKFLGWSTDPNATEVTETTFTAENGKLELYAVWQKKYTLTVNGASGANTEAITFNTTVYLNEDQLNLYLTEIDAAAKKQDDNVLCNKYFGSWSVDLSTITTASFDQNKSLTIAATWNTKNTVKATWGTFRPLFVTYDIVSSFKVNGTSVSKNGSFYVIPGQSYQIQIAAYSGLTANATITGVTVSGGNNSSIGTGSGTEVSVQYVAGTAPSASETITVAGKKK